ncbi:hypothetical protein B0H14DRAFT_3548586 [Mycena olivaceomarginata]|nr:hypothetical protein B0H14DRAFT_3548586 [Mycena olivaceomarginata]
MALSAKLGQHVVGARRARADDTAYTPGVSKAEVARRHAKEKVEKDLESVHALEAQLDITERWTVVEIKKRKYQLALDAVEVPNGTLVAHGPVACCD